MAGEFGRKHPGLVGGAELGRALLHATPPLKAPLALIPRRSFSLSLAGVEEEASMASPVAPTGQGISKEQVEKLRCATTTTTPAQDRIAAPQQTHSTRSTAAPQHRSKLQQHSNTGRSLRRASLGNSVAASDGLRPPPLLLPPPSPREAIGAKIKSLGIGEQVRELLAESLRERGGAGGAAFTREEAMDVLQVRRPPPIEPWDPLPGLPRRWAVDGLKTAPGSGAVAPQV